MPALEAYGQSQGFDQQPQQRYYAQGQFQGAPGGDQPAKKKTGLIIGIIAAVLVVAIIAGVAIWAFTKDDSSDDDSAAQSAPSATAPSAVPSGAPSAGANPAQPPVGTNPSQPPVGTNPSQPPAGTSPSKGTGPGAGSDPDMEKQAIAECTKEINSDYTNANVSDTKLELKESYGETKWWDYTGTVTGTSTITNKPVTTRFTCSVFYFSSTKEYSAVVIPETY